MTETEKLILEKLENLDKKVTETQASTERKLESLDKKVTETQAATERKLESLDKKVTEAQAVTERKLEILDKKITETQLLIENEIGKKINIIGEGHDFLKMRLEEALQMEKKRERMELDIVDLRIEIKKIKSHLNIA